MITFEVLQLDRPSKRDRELILKFLEALADDPWKRGDYQEQDNVGRPVQIKVIGKLALTYWADHAVQEVKVTKIEVADRD